MRSRLLAALFVVLLCGWATPAVAQFSGGPTTIDAGGTACNANAVSCVTDGSVSVTNGDLILFAVTISSGPAFTISATTDGLGGLTWSRHTSDSACNSNFCVTIWTAQATSTTSGTITANVSSGTPGRWLLQTFVVTGHNTSTPISQSAELQGDTSTTPTVTLSSPAASSMLFCALGSQSESDTTAGTGFTELLETVGSSISHLATMYDLDNADTSADWSGANTTNNNAVCVEIAEAAAAGCRHLSLLGVGGGCSAD